MSSTIRIAILDDYQSVALTSADWSSIQAKATVDVIHEALGDDTDVVVDRLKEYDIICAMRERTKFTRAVLDKLPRLKLLNTTGMRNLGIDVVFARSKGIEVCGTTYGPGGVASFNTTEHIWALILAVTRHIVTEDANVKSHNPQWQTVVPTGIAGKTLGLLGCGRLGSDVGRIAKAFHMRVLGWSPHLTPERAAEAGVELAASKEALFAESDVVSIHLISVPATYGIVGRKELDLMKPTAYLINTSRGPLVDEDALVDVLKKGGIRGAGLDVYNVEPLPLDHALRDLRNVTLSPHNGYVSDSSYSSFFPETVENILAFWEGQPKRQLFE